MTQTRLQLNKQVSIDSQQTVNRQIVANNYVKTLELSVEFKIADHSVKMAKQYSGPSRHTTIRNKQVK